MKDLVQEAWHQVDRLGAEAILANKALGSFFFRKDEYAARLEEQLNAHLEKKVVCFTLSYLETKDHVIDRTIVCKEGRWYFYDDDPQLNELSYESIEDLLTHAGSSLTYPVYKVS